MKKLRSIYHWICNLYENIVTAMFAGVIIVLIIQVFGRYVFSIATPWTEELARMLLVILTLLASVAVTRKGEHLGAYFLRDKAPGRPKAAIFLIIGIFELVIMVLLCKGGYDIYSGMGDTRGISIRWFRRQWLFFVLMLSCGLNCLYIARDIINSFLAIIGKKQIEGSGMSSPFPEER